MENNRRPTQCQMVINYIKEFNSITTAEAFLDLGIMRLGARVSELRNKQGLRIVGKTECVKNRFGEKCHIKRYFLEEQKTNETMCNL